MRRRDSDLIWLMEHATQLRNQGLRNDEIAERMRVSDRTVRRWIGPNLHPNVLGSLKRAFERRANSRK